MQHQQQQQQQDDLHHGQHEPQLGLNLGLGPLSSAIHGISNGTGNSNGTSSGNGIASIQNSMPPNSTSTGQMSAGVGMGINLGSLSGITPSNPNVAAAAMAAALAAPLIDAREARTLRVKKLDEFVADKMNKLSAKIRQDAGEGYGQVAVDVSEWLDPVYMLVAQAFRKQNFHVHFEDKEGNETEDTDPRGCKMIIDWDMMQREARDPRDTHGGHDPRDVHDPRDDDSWFAGQ
jgi:hypothetical protein